MMALLFAVPLFAAEGPDPESWQFQAEMYLWGASIGGATGDGVDLDVDFSDLISNFKLGVMGTIAAGKGKWTFLTDAVYLNVGNSSNKPIEPGLALDDLNLIGWVVNPLVGYNLFYGDSLRLDVVAGVRYLYLKTDLKFQYSDPNPNSLQKVSDSEDNWDAIGGLRARVNLSPSWYLPLYADIGGGDSELTWQIQGGIAYQFSRIDLLLAYRYLQWDFKSGKALNDLNFSGPVFGLKYHF